MGDDHRNDDDVPPRFRRLRVNPLRDVLPIVVGVVGVVVAVSGWLRMNAGGDPLNPLVGVGLAVLGIVTFFINRWQAKRGS